MILCALMGYFQGNFNLHLLLQMRMRETYLEA
jgi:hypothetical protein